MYTWVITTTDGKRFALDAWTYVEAKELFKSDHPELEVESVHELKDY